MNITPALSLPAIDPTSLVRGKPTARLIASSINENGNWVRTFSVKGHLMILPESNTHRTDSKSIQSGRAVPTVTLRERMLSDIAYPVYYGKNRPGMSAIEETLEYVRHPFTGAMLRPDEAWKAMAEMNAAWCEALTEAKWHKQLSNRPMSPFLYYHGTITATERDNYYGLRRHADAQPEIRALADAMWEAEQAAPPPKLLEPGEWHTPWVEEEDHETIHACILQHNLPSEAFAMLVNLVSAARCARSSYSTFDGRRSTVESDIALCLKLIKSDPVHASPFEHPCTPDKVTLMKQGFVKDNAYSVCAVWNHPEDHRNFKGWRQLRAFLERGELNYLLEGPVAKQFLLEG